jgi:4-hydroxythreonine-4-phosphate dehydrogenase
VIDAIATAPINKLAFARAGLAWKGHTDLLAHLTGSDQVAMMFWSEPLKVVLASVHVPLARVAHVVTRQQVEGIIDVTARELPVFGIKDPRLALAGLNPHAGEGGVLGDEEQRVLEPAVEAARSRGIRIDGPFPGDTVFIRAVRGEFDAVIACYHDQGLIPVKLLAFGRAVNVTLGLPFVRTSVDHGTAFDIAGKGIADASSLIEAVLLAARLVQARLPTRQPAARGGELHEGHRGSSTPSQVDAGSGQSLARKASASCCRIAAARQRSSCLVSMSGTVLIRDRV